MKQRKQRATVTEFCNNKNMSLFSTKKLNQDNYLAPMNRTKLGCLTWVKVLTSLLNSLRVLSVLFWKTLSFFIATSASLYVPLYTSALAPAPIYFSILRSFNFSMKKSWLFWNSSSKILLA